MWKFELVEDIAPGWWCAWWFGWIVVGEVGCEKVGLNVMYVYFGRCSTLLIRGSKLFWIVKTKVPDVAVRRLQGSAAKSIR
jgi:hypothetical protein